MNHKTKNLTLATALLLALTFTGCSNENNKKKSSKDANLATSESTNNTSSGSDSSFTSDNTKILETIKPGEKVNYNGLDCTYLGYEEFKSLEEPEPGKKFIRIKMLIENNTDQTIPCVPQVECTVNGEQIYNNNCYINDSVNKVRYVNYLAPQCFVYGYTYFEVPADLENVTPSLLIKEDFFTRIGRVYLDLSDGPGLLDCELPKNTTPRTNAVAIGETIKSKKANYTLTECKFIDDSAVDSPEEYLCEYSHRNVICRFEVEYTENDSNGFQASNSDFNVYADKYLVESYIRKKNFYQESIKSYVDLKSGEKGEIDIICRIPSDTQTLEFQTSDDSDETISINMNDII